jgi:serine/threonine protein kinase
MTLSYASPPDPLTSSTVRFGRFYVVRELGRGALGTVYQGHDPVIDRSVAIKTFSSHLSSAEKKHYEPQFINEARAAGRLSHPNIVTIYDASSEGGTTYIAMEYLHGHELSKLLEDGKQFPMDEVASIISKIADALDYAHKNGVVHRDIKPANIFMVNDNFPKIVDFSIARAPNRVSDQPGYDNRAYTLFHNNLLGTPNYMSPEQAMGRTVDARTDVYSLGAVMYEMLAKRRPFQSQASETLLEMIAYKAPPAPHELDPKIPMALSQIVIKAMSKRPEKRYQNAEEMALDIKRYLTRERRARARGQLPAAAHEHNASMRVEKRDYKMLWAGVITVTYIVIVACLFWLR